MKILTVAICVLFMISASANNHDRNKHHGPKFEPSKFEVTPLNSPVKGPTAKFSLKLPKGFEVDKVKVKLVNVRDLTKDQKKFDEVKVSNNNELSVSVSKLPPGFYRLYVTVVDKKSKKEHCFQSKYHDFVRFVVDESLQVPIPDPVKNNATVAGIDSDKDGIRDDIQRFINSTYANEPQTKLALKQYAATYQNVLLTADDKDLSIQASFLSFESSFCLAGILGLRPSFKIEDELKAKILNTKERLIAEKKADLNFHGQSGSAPGGTAEYLSSCNF